MEVSRDPFRKPAPSSRPRVLPRAKETGERSKLLVSGRKNEKEDYMATTSPLGSLYASLYTAHKPANAGEVCGRNTAENKVERWYNLSPPARGDSCSRFEAGAPWTRSAPRSGKRWRNIGRVGGCTAPRRGRNESWIRPLEQELLTILIVPYWIWVS